MRLNALIKDTIADYESHFMGFEPATSRFKTQIYNNYTTESILNMIHKLISLFHVKFIMKCKLGMLSDSDCVMCDSIFFTGKRYKNTD